MRRVPLLLALALVLGAPPQADAAPTTIELETGSVVSDIRIGRIDADDVPDILMLEGRTLRIWRGRRGKAPTPQPTWRIQLDDAVNFVATSVPADAETLTTLRSDGIRALTLPGGKTQPQPPQQPGYALGWRDPEQARFAALTRAGRSLLPTENGWRLLDAGAPVDLTVSRYRKLTAPGPFLEDTCTVLQALPEVFVGTPAGPADKGPALWAIDGRALIGQSRSKRVRYDLSFLSAEAGATFDQTLVDLDGDDRPDVLHRIHTNRETRYGFFRTKPAATGAASGPSHQPATTALFLSGFQLDPDLVDLDGDGLKDLVVTSMQVNAPNMMGALTSGRVTAETRAFLNRWRDGKGRYFDAKPDAVVKSQVGVKVQFNYAGNIEVIRSFTILLDGDFDGDGRKDLAIRTGPDELTIHPGVAGEAGVWADTKSARTVKIPPKGVHADIDGYAADVDGDGKDEIVLVYRKGLGGEDRVRIVDPGF